MSPWLTIIGVGDEGIENLPPASRVLLDAAEVVFGSKRILDRAALTDKETIAWASPFEKAMTQLKDSKGRNVVVLSTGDPTHYGASTSLLRHVPAEEMTVVPAPSAFSLAAARLKWALQDVETLSLHARPVSLLQPFIQPGARILALTEGDETVKQAAAMLRERGFYDSKLTVLEHMGGPFERIVTTTAKKCGQQDFADFNTLAIECVAGPEANILPRVPGLPDDAFAHDGQLTKREVRAATLAALGPTPGALLWDVGAGCGSVAIEWIRFAARMRAIAFEQDPDRVNLIAQNAVALGAPGLEIISGSAAETLKGNEQPQAVFLGGAVENEKIFKTCWNALPAGGRLVANAVTLEGETALVSRLEKHGGELIRIGISYLDTIGKRRAMRPRMAVTQWRAVKE